MDTSNKIALAEKAMSGWYLQSRHHFIANMASKALAGRVPAECKILDAGCGSGGVSGLLLSRGYHVVGCDMDADSIRQGLTQGRLREVHRVDVAKLPFEDDAFDLVICSEVIEHVPDDELALCSLLRVARRDVLLSVPAHSYLWTPSDTILGHRRRYSRADVKQVIQKSGARLIQLGAYGAMPAAGVLAFKTAHLFKAGRKETKKNDVSNAMRFQFPPTIDRLLWALSSAELYASGLGLVPWGFAWWAIARKSAGHCPN
jgi:SAM-dependent methyltransferase